MTRRQHAMLGLGLQPLFATAARAECLGDCGYGPLIAGVAALALAVMALVIFVMIRLGIGWLIKWLVGAGLLFTIIPPSVIAVLHNHRLTSFEALDFAGPLPRMADRTPVFVIHSAGSYSCPRTLERYIAARSWEGVLILETWTMDDSADLSRPVSLADLPLQLRTTRMVTVTDDPNVAGSYQMEETANRPLTAEERQAAAAEVDYLVFAQCRGSNGVLAGFRDNPALKGTTDRFDVELAMAPLAKGSGVLSLRELTFDLLDLRYDGVTEGFLFARSLRGGPNIEPYDPAALRAAFCVKAGGTGAADCGG